MKNTVEIKVNEMKKQVERMEKLAGIYKQITDCMNWDVMINTNEADEDGDVIWKAPDTDDWRYDTYVVWCEVMKHIEKLIK